jgi:alpha-mannosidase
VDGGSLQAPPFALAELGSLVPAWVKPETDGFTLRLHECSGRRGSAVLRLADTPARVELVDFLDRPQGKPLAVKDRTVRLDYAPYQVLSVRVR